MGSKPVNLAVSCVISVCTVQWIPNTVLLRCKPKGWQEMCVCVRARVCVYVLYMCVCVCAFMCVCVCKGKGKVIPITGLCGLEGG